MLTKRGLIINFIRNNKRITVSIAVFGFLSIITSVLTPLFLAKFYQLALRTHSARGTVFDEIFGRIRDINLYFILFGLLITLKFIFDYCQRYFSGVGSERFSRSLREQLFARQLRTRFSVFSKKETGKYLLRYSGDLTAIQHYFTDGIVSFIKDCLFFTLAMVLLLVINVQLALIVIVLFPVIFLLIVILNRKLKKLTRKRRNIRSQNLAFVSSRLNAMLTVKSFNRENVESEKYEKRSENLYNYGIKYYRLFALFSALMPYLLYLMLLVVLVSAYQINHRGEEGIPGSVILIFILQVVNFIPAMKRILKVTVVWQAGDVSLTKLLNILNMEEENLQKTEEEKFTEGSIEFEHVDFAFGENKPILKDISFKISGNSLSLLQGPHGSGKSLLFKLILGLYDCNAGRILMEGKDVKNLSRHNMRRNISIVSDEMPLLGNTVFEAVSYSRKEEKRMPAKEVLNQVGFRVDNSADVLDYPLIDGGKNLSAGQKKLLLITRALLTNKKIILFDEPFFDLDTQYQQVVSGIINRLKTDHTILVIDSSDNKMLNYDKVIQLAMPVLVK